MSELQRLGRPECDEVLDQLEKLKVGKASEGEVLSALPAEARAHALACEDCRLAIADFIATREALEAVKSEQWEPGPWFAARVMTAVRAAESEIEERREGVWVSVRRLAPRLAAFAALLLVLGGTWAMELRRREAASGQAQVRQVEGLFESTSNTPLNDEIVATAGGDKRR